MALCSLLLETATCKVWHFLVFLEALAVYEIKLHIFSVREM